MKPATENPERWGGVQENKLPMPSGGVVIFWSNTTDKSQSYIAVHWKSFIGN